MINLPKYIKFIILDYLSKQDILNLKKTCTQMIRSEEYFQYKCSQHRIYSKPNYLSYEKFYYNVQKSGTLYEYKEEKEKIDEN